MTIATLIALSLNLARAASVEPALAQLETTLSHPPAAHDCAPALAAWRTPFRAAAVDPADASAATLRRLFGLRQRVRGYLGTLTPAPDACVDEVRRTLGALRYAEDHLALAMRGSGAAPGQGRGTHAWLTTADGGGEVKLRSGDVLASRGDTFTSAAIAHIGAVEGDFSHVSQVYIDADEGTEVSIRDAVTDSRVFTVEAHIERGSVIRQFDAYLHDNHARIAVFRPRQSARRAHRAAWSVFDWVKRWQLAHAAAFDRVQPTVNDNPPYDFKMDVNDPSEVFCSELIRIGQAAVGWSVPRYHTTLKVNSLTKTMGITVKTTFAPIDMEVDARFDEVAEWRDLDKLGTVLKRDVVFTHIFTENAAGRLSLRPTAKENALALFAWTVRQADLGLTDQMPKNMSPWILAMTFAIDRVGQWFEDQLTGVP